MTVRRSVYADKLSDFADFAFGDEAAFERRGRWRDFFRDRMGSAFKGRVIFEIGCFDAGYLATIAAKHPGVGFVGLDWKAKSLYDGAVRVTGAGLNNIALLRGRGQDLRRMFGDGEVDEIWIFHPEPCDREVELKNRLVSEPFLNEVHQVLSGPTSTLSLKTDHRGYYEWMMTLLELPAVARRFEVTMNSADYWRDPAAIAHTAERYFAGETTLFENRFLKKRKPIYYLEIRKK